MSDTSRPPRPEGRTPSGVPEGGGGTNGGPGPEDLAFMNRLARWLVERRLSVPAVLFIESSKPLNFVGSQFLFFFEPMVKIFVGGEGYTRFASLMEERENVEIFLQCIEAAEAAPRTGKPEKERR